jgi:hypothetical protein
MREHGGNTYRPWEPQRYQQAAHRPASKLPEGDRVFVLLDGVATLDVSRFYAPYEKEPRGAPPFVRLCSCACCSMRTTWGCFRVAKSPWRANVIWPFGRSWVKTAPTCAPSVTFARCLWRRSKRGLCRWCGELARQAWSSWALCPPMARQARARHRVTRRCVRGIGSRKWRGFAKTSRRW